MRILLIRTSPVGAAFREPAPPAVTAPLGILYLAAAVRRELGDAVEVQIESLSTAVRSPGEIPALVEEREPDVVGISGSLVEEPDAIAVSRAARAMSREPLVVLGGPYPSCSPQRALERTGAHLAVVGEGERAFVEIVRARMQGQVGPLPGVARLDEGGEMVDGGPVEYVQDPDDIPLPA